MTRIALTVNDVPIQADVEPRTSIADFLRRFQFLTGTHLGCEHGVCGACTIMLDNEPARSCISLAVALHGAKIRTIEGFESDPAMAALRVAFREEHALQCGFCTSGMLISAHDIVSRFAEPDEKRIRAELAGNICRCTGYVGIVNAIQRVIRELPPTERLRRSPKRQGLEPRGLTGPFQTFVAKRSEPQKVKVLERTASARTEAKLEKGWSRIVDFFVVNCPRSEVWALLDNPRQFTQCMPGVELVSSDGREINGRVHVTFGPIKAIFACRATIERTDSELTGVVSGAGGDERSESRVKGRLKYALIEIDALRTRIDIVLDYQLQGALAQFGRSGLVQGFVSQLIAQFGDNLSAVLAGNELRHNRSDASFGVVSALRASFLMQFRRWLGRWSDNS